MFLKRRKEIPQNTGNGLVGLQVDFRSEKRGSSQEESSECWCFYILEFLYFYESFLYKYNNQRKRFSGRSASSVEAYIKEQVKDYKLTIKEQDSKSDVIKGSDISLQYKESDEIEKALKKQNGFAWPLALFSKNQKRFPLQFHSMKLL